MITRRQFIKVCGALGLTVPLLGCGDDEPSGGFDGRVVVIGAGVAGLSAAHLLQRRDVDVRVLEAAATYGGRIKRTTEFVDFPISLGGEWLEAPERELARIVDDPSVDLDVRLVGYDPDDPTASFDGELVYSPLGEFGSLNFVESSWFDFFDEHIVPGISSRLTFGTEIVEIDHTGDPIRLTDASGTVHEADRVIVTVPLRVLQEERLRFTPPLPARKQRAIDDALVWGGIKAFFEFDEAFYPSWVEFPDSDTATGQRYYYDAAYRRDTTTNVLGLFAVGTGAEPYQARTDDALRDHVLAELDEVFDGAASRSYLRHIVQDWSEEPFIGQAYLADTADPAIPPVLREPIDGRIHFAGEAYTRHDDWGSVDDAARAAREVVDRILA
ncbi:MAG: NAD(P)/FAD-dependent oxidoreductase [Actinomycetota bacterium]